MQTINKNEEILKNTSIIKDVIFGKNVQYFNFVNLYGCEIGDETKIGSYVEIQKNAFIGKRCKISSHTFICEGIYIGNDVFVGHGVVFINDKFPKASFGKKLIKDNWKLEKTYVEDEVSIGSNVTILCGIKIGKGAIIGAGSVVTKDVLPGETVVGNPAKVLRKRNK